MALVDQFGKEIRDAKPIVREIAVQGVRDRYNNYPSHGLTPERLATILKEADLGNVKRQSELFEEMEEKDCHLGGILSTRRLAVSGLDYEIHPASDSEEDKRIAKAAQEMIEGIADFDDVLNDLLDAVGKGFSVLENMWEVSERQVWLRCLKWVHQKRFTFYSQERLLDYPRLLTDGHLYGGEELPPYKFVYHRHKARSGAPSRGGLSRPCAFMYLFKNFDIKDWLIFNDLYSVPMRIGKYKPGAQKEEIETLKTAVWNLGVDAAAVISDSTIIELVESKSRGNVTSFQDLAEFCDRAMSKCVLGHTGSAEGTPGKLGNDDQAKDVRQDLLEADAKGVMSTIRFQILKPWVVYNYGPDKAVPKFTLHYAPGDDLEKTAKVYGHLVRDVGFKDIPVDHIHERFGIPKAKKGELTLRETQPTDPGGSDFQANKGCPVCQTNKGNGGGFTKDVLGEGDEKDTVDRMTERLIAEADTSAFVDPVEQLVQNAASLEEVRDGLIELYADMDPSDLGNKLHTALLAAELSGRFEAKEGK